MCVIRICKIPWSYFYPNHFLLQNCIKDSARVLYEDSAFKQRLRPKHTNNGATRSTVGGHFKQRLRLRHKAIGADRVPYEDAAFKQRLRPKHTNNGATRSTVGGHFKQRLRPRHKAIGAARVPYRTKTLLQSKFVPENTPRNNGN